MFLSDSARKTYIDHFQKKKKKKGKDKKDKSMRSLRKRRSSKSSKKKLTKEKTECGTIAKSPKKASEKDSAKEGEEKKDTGKAKTTEPTEEMKAAKNQVTEEKGSQPPPKSEKPPEAEKEKPAAEPPTPQKPVAAETKEPPKEEKKVQTSVRLKPSQSAPNLGSEKAAGQAVTQKSVVAQPQGTPAAKPQAQQVEEAPKEEKAPKEDQARNEEKATPKEEKSQRSIRKVVPKEEKSQRSFRISLRLRRKRQQQQQTTKEEKSVRATSIRERVKRGLKSAFSVFSRESIEKSFQTAKNKMTATIRTATYAYQDTYFGLGSDLDDDMEEDEDEVFLRDMSHRPDLTLVEGNNNNDGELFNDKGVPFWKDKKYLAEVPKQTRKPLSTLLLSLAEKKLTLKESVPEP
ncbi:hypothetical protein OESDEN_11836 [Oesophagostomum dentatum]|uniref:Uncharacterized protein n=1 Tax=Oesophagostomum dentatum TaxID=61180 RepID=A0A0B1SWS5_OESDE|nr:hypothetical protein OESDEN_11836 [Oesophagostomum dentatum]